MILFQTIAPTLFNIHTNDQPILTQAGTKHFIYADDTALAAQGVIDRVGVNLTFFNLNLKIMTKPRHCIHYQ